VVSQTERLIYDHISRAPIGMCPEALASELAVVIGPHVPEREDDQ
jgi:hypothetical protein